jgi:hypothetical protein
MCLDDGTADREPNAHTVVLCTVERFEETIGSIGSKADSGILHNEPNVHGAVPFRLNEQLPRSIFNFPDRVYGIAKQIYDHLLKLYAVAVDRWEIIHEIHLQNHPTPAQFTRRERNYLAGCLIQIDHFGYKVFPLKEGPQARDDIRGSIPVAN